MMRFFCPFCNFAISADDSARGYRAVCGACGKSVLVPAGLFDDGRIIGDFIIRSKLGEGSIGAVYKAMQISLERIVALKILSKKHMTQKGVAEFLKEARAAAKLTHTNLVQSYAVGEEDGVCYMAMTYINGETLKSRIKREGRIATDEALHIVQQVAEALYYAWDEARIIHRDVKPDNIMLSENGVVKLTDLGLAMNQSEWHENMDISGSPSYMSPEQFAGEKLDSRSDIYSLGVTLYQMLSGELPFDANTVKSIARQHFEMDIPNLLKRVPDLPPRVNSLVRKMMAKVPEKRFPDMEALLKEIWSIRQITAPDRELVPDVHTISMKRLDYDIQTQEARKNFVPDPRRSQPPRYPFGKSEPHIRLNSPEVAAEKKAMSFWMLIVSWVIAGILLVIMIFSHAGSKSNSPSLLDRFGGDLKDFEDRMSDSDLSDGEMELAADRILRNLDKAEKSDPRQAALIRAFVQLQMKGRTLKLRSDELKKLKARVTELETENGVLLADRDDAKRRLEELEAVPPDASAGEENARLQTKLDELDRSFQAYREHSDLTIRPLLALARDHFAVRFCLCWKTQNFNECTEIVRLARLDFPELKDDFSTVEELNGKIRKVFQALNEKKTVTADLAPAKPNAWRDWTPDEADAFLARKKDFTSSAENKAFFEMLRGNFGSACVCAPAKSPLRTIVDRYCRVTAKGIRIFAEQDLDAAQKKFVEFRRIFSGAPSFAAESDALQILFKNESDGEIAPPALPAPVKGKE